jgi:hypothetical protein
MTKASSEAQRHRVSGLRIEGHQRQPLRLKAEHSHIPELQAGKYLTPHFSPEKLFSPALHVAENGGTGPSVEYATIRRFQDAPWRREESIHGWGLIRMDKSRTFGPCTFSAALDHAFMCTLCAKQLIGEQLFAECEYLIPKMLVYKLSCAFQHRHGYSLPDTLATKK